MRWFRVTAGTREPYKVGPPGYAGRDGLYKFLAGRTTAKTPYGIAVLCERERDRPTLDGWFAACWDVPSDPSALWFGHGSNHPLRSWMQKHCTATTAPQDPLFGGVWGEGRRAWYIIEPTEDCPP